MKIDKNSAAITKAKKNWLWTWAEPESSPTVLPKSKTERLALQAKLANIDAERAISRAYQIELTRTKAVGEAMFKSGKALRYTVTSSARQILLRTEAARREFEPGYRNK
tara:strand:- start:315 stop:641 length:327 start_codon:yes stop_codon:yes gene_type:complete